MQYYREIVRINEKLSQINRKLDEIIKYYDIIFKTISQQVQFGDNEQKVLSLPKHLQTTFLALNKLGTATSVMISSATGRARAVESCYLNQLVSLGYAIKRRNRRQVLFSSAICIVQNRQLEVK